MLPYRGRILLESTSVRLSLDVRTTFSLSLWFGFPPGLPSLDSFPLGFHPSSASRVPLATCMAATFAPGHNLSIYSLPSTGDGYSLSLILNLEKDESETVGGEIGVNWGGDEVCVQYRKPRSPLTIHFLIVG